MVRPTARYSGRGSCPARSCGSVRRSLLIAATLHVDRHPAIGLATDPSTSFTCLKPGETDRPPAAQASSTDRSACFARSAKPSAPETTFSRTPSPRRLGRPDGHDLHGTRRRPRTEPAAHRSLVPVRRWSGGATCSFCHRRGLVRAQHLSRPECGGSACVRAGRRRGRGPKRPGLVGAGAADQYHRPVTPKKGRDSRPRQRRAASYLDAVEDSR